jgi:hypothetical protein
MPLFNSISSEILPVFKIGIKHEISEMLLKSGIKNYASEILFKSGIKNYTNEIL